MSGTNLGTVREDREMAAALNELELGTEFAFVDTKYKITHELRKSSADSDDRLRWVRAKCACGRSFCNDHESLFVDTGKQLVYFLQADVWVESDEFSLRIPGYEDDDMASLGDFV